MNSLSDLPTLILYAHAHETSFRGHAKQCLKLSLRQGLKGHDLYAALEGRTKFMTQAWPYLAAGSLKGLELKFEMIEREKKRVTGMFIGCSWASLEQYGPGLNAGSVCMCLHAYMCACQCVCVWIMHACERRGMRYWVNTDQSLDISRYMCVSLCDCVCVWKKNKHMYASSSVLRACMHANMCVSDRDIWAIWKSLGRKYGSAVWNLWGEFWLRRQEVERRKKLKITEMITS